MSIPDRVVRRWRMWLLFLMVVLPRARAANPGEVDPAFVPELAVNGAFHAVVVQPDGKFLVGGAFSSVRGLVRTNLARLHADGTGDPSFQPSLPVGMVGAMALQADGRLLVASLESYEECFEDWGCEPLSRPVLYRLLPDGRVDAGFRPVRGDPGVTHAFTAVHVQPDQKILLGGNFTQLHGTNRNGLGRLQADGALDADFHSGAGPGGHQARVAALAVQSDGRILVGGQFSHFDGVPRKGLARLRPDGVLDTAFDPAATWGGDVPRAQSIVLQPDGRILVGGYFSQATGTGLVRLLVDGSLDAGFVPETGPFGPGAGLPFFGAEKLLLGTGGRVVVAGVHLRPAVCDDQGCTAEGFTNRLFCLNADGSIDASFAPSTVGPRSWRAVRDLVALPDGGMLVAGEFMELAGVETRSAAALRADGTVDSRFHAGRTLGRPPDRLAEDADGGLLLGGEVVVDDVPFGPATDALPFVNGPLRHARARILPDGRLDPGFVPDRFDPPFPLFLLNEGCDDLPPGFSCHRGVVSAGVVVEPGGTVLVAGNSANTITGEETFAQVSRPFLARFGALGGLLGRFTNLPPGYVSVVVRQPDGKLVLGGSFTVGGVEATLVRLLPDGRHDESFVTGQGPRSVSGLVLQADGSLIAGGVSGLARLHPDGTRDPCYNPDIAEVRALALQGDGQLIVGGAFSTVNGLYRKGVARIHPDGRLDETFASGEGVDGPVSCLLVQRDGGVIIGGNFARVHGVSRRYVARLVGGNSGSILRIVPQGTGLLRVSWPAQVSGARLQQATRLGPGLPDWADIPSTPIVVGGESQVSIAAGAERYFRLRGGPSPEPGSPVPPPLPSTWISVLPGDASVSLAWTNWPGAHHHRLERSESLEGPFSLVAEGQATAHKDIGLVNGRTYYYRVFTTYACGRSAPTRTVAAVPVLPLPRVHVQGITLNWVPSGDRFRVRATVQLATDTGVPVRSSSVYGDFTGAINNPSHGGDTNPSGVANVNSSSSVATGSVTFTIRTVNTYGRMVYDPEANATTSATLSR